MESEVELTDLGVAEKNKGTKTHVLLKIGEPPIRRVLWIPLKPTKEFHEFEKPPWARWIPKFHVGFPESEYRSRAYGFKQVPHCVPFLDSTLLLVAEENHSIFRVRSYWVRASAIIDADCFSPFWRN